MRGKKGKRNRWNQRKRRVRCSEVGRAVKYFSDLLLCVYVVWDCFFFLLSVCVVRFSLSNLKLRSIFQLLSICRNSLVALMIICDYWRRCEDNKIGVSQKGGADVITTSLSLFFPFAVIYISSKEGTDERTIKQLNLLRKKEKSQNTSFNIRDQVKLRR